MSKDTFRDVPIEQFGGLCTQLAPGDVPLGLSPDCRDVEFYPGGLRTRGGALAVFTDAAAVIYRGLRAYRTRTLASRVLALVSDGRLQHGNTVETLADLFTKLATGLYLQGASAFGREYLGFSDGKTGRDLPRSYDQVNLDRVSQEGPGEGPAAADHADAGNVSAGVHKVAVWFVTRGGYETRPSPPVEWTAAGAKKVHLTGIPLGPANVVKRRVAFTAAGGARYYHVAATMELDDNTTTELVVDFTDAALLSARYVDRLFNLEVLPYAAVPVFYGSRLFWLGCEPQMQDWRNLSFDGGFSGGRPLGWTAGAAVAGGAAESADTLFGGAYKITGDGATAVRGEITQAALLDAWTGAVPLIERNRAYRVRARVKKTAGLAAGRLNLDLFGTALDTAGLQLTAAQVSASYVEYEAELIASQATLPADLVLRVFADQTPTNAESFLVEEIRIFPADEDTAASVVRVSGVEAPGSYDGVTGFFLVAEDNGEALRAAFPLRNFLYLVKSGSLHVTADDGVNEPYRWTVEEVDSTVGTPSALGVGVGEGWAVIASPRGLYRFSGGLPVKVTSEIQPTWDAINWKDAGHKVWVKVDKNREQVLVGVPLGAGQAECNRVLVLNYTEGWANPLEAGGRGRKWSLWHLAAASGELLDEVIEGPPRVLVGNAAANGKVYEVKGTQRSDDGAAIPWHYDTAYLSRGGQASSGRSLFGYLTLFAEGAGKVKVSYTLPGAAAVELAELDLADPGTRDLELLLNIVSERVSFRLAGNQVGGWADVSKLVPAAKGEPWAPVRGR